MHILATHHRSEFLATPELVRITLASRNDTLEPVLLIKANSFNLKQLLFQKEIPIIIEVDELQRVAYGIQLQDESGPTSYLWSWVEESFELEALAALCRKDTLTAHLFNELAINVASSGDVVTMSAPTDLLDILG